MKQYAQLLLFILISGTLLAQARKPRIMVVPTDKWCYNHGYAINVDNFGKIEKVPDYQKALDENNELSTVILAINTLYTNREFDLVVLGEELATIKRNSAEDAAMNLDRQAAGKAALTESLFDKVRNRAKVDILIKIDWTIEKVGPQQKITYSMAGIDNYSNKQIAGTLPTTSQPSFSSSLTQMLQEAVLHNIDNFNAQLMKHFEDLFTNGREITVELRRDETTWDKNFETEYNGEELNKIIEDWMSKNTVKGRFTTLDATENKIVFTQVRIPMYNANQRAIDASDFGTSLKKFLNAAPYNIEVKVVKKGLGSVQLICGKK